jgi:hypothetical protein
MRCLALGGVQRCVTPVFFLASLDCMAVLHRAARQAGAIVSQLRQRCASGEPSSVAHVPVHLGVFNQRSAAKPLDTAGVWLLSFREPPFREGAC